MARAEHDFDEVRGALTRAAVALAGLKSELADTEARLGGAERELGRSRFQAKALKKARRFAPLPTSGERAGGVIAHW